MYIEHSDRGVHRRVARSYKVSPAHYPRTLWVSVVHLFPCNSYYYGHQTNMLLLDAFMVTRVYNMMI
ncbi:hypothetical protein X801_00500, partial [Opisthorchis viverrini]